MNSRNPHSLFLVLTLAIVAALAAACGTTGTPATGSAAVPVLPLVGAEPTPAAVADSADSSEAGTGTIEVAGDSEVDEFGIPVGFTAEGRPYRGDPHAPVVMEEFSDFQCPFCGRFSQETLPALLEDQIAAGEVVLIFYDFPLTNIHPQATAAANAARCAGEQGAAAYWAMHDRLFVNIREWSSNRAGQVFGDYAAELGLDLDSFNTCVAEGRYNDAIAADLDLGRSRGVSSTPSFFLNDQPLVGAQPASVFVQAIAAVLEGQEIASAPSEPQRPQPGVAPTPAAIAADDIAAALGDPNAPVTIVEYTDYQCPFCARYSAETWPSMLAQMVESGRVYYQLKDFPLDNLHPEARLAAAGARCAGEQDAYWPMHDALFARQGEWSGKGLETAGVLSTIADDLSLDVAAFDACLESGRYDEAIQANLDEGLALGVRGTPSFFIAGFPVSGAQPYELFEYAVGLAEEGTLADAYVQNEPAEPDPSVPVEVETEGAHSIGDPDAPVVIVEFTDFQCPYCGRHFQQTFPQIKANYIDTGMVRYVFKDFPLTNIHPQATLAAQAARCAGEQDAYLEMHGALFNSQQAWSNRSDAAETFTSLAADAGMDAEAFRTCLDDGRHEAAVSADLAEGIELGVSGTPAFFINGYYLSGAQPYAVFEQAIAELAVAGETE